jgi:hypothetical protein
MKTSELATHLITFLTNKGLRDEANQYIEDIEAGNKPEVQGDKLSQLTTGRKQPKRDYNKHLLPILQKANGKPVDAVTLLAGYKTSAQEAGLTGFEDVTKAQILSHCKSSSAAREGIVHIADTSTFKYGKPATK